MKSAALCISLSGLFLLLPATGSAASSRPDAAAIIQDVLYGQVDAVIADTGPQERPLHVIVVDEIDPDDLELSSTELVPLEIEWDEVDKLSPEERLRRMIRVLRALPFKTKQEQINDLLATVHTLPV